MLPTNLKHRCVLEIGYSSGLRIREVLDLLLTDVDSERMLLRVNQGKGNKDRFTVLSNSLLLKLRDCYRLFTPKKYLFEEYYGFAYSKSSVQKILN